MSSHREAPEISQDPVADNTDIYAFVSPDKPDTVTIITNYLPLEARPAARTSTSSATTSCTRSTSTTTATGTPTSRTSSSSRRRSRNEDTFLYNTGPIGVARQPELEPAAVLLRHERRRATAAPPADVLGARTWPLAAVQHRPALDAELRRAGQRRRSTTLPERRGSSPGQRNEGFFVDLGSIFDLGDLRPIQNLHLIADAPAIAGVDTLATLNVHTIAIQVPISRPDAGRLGAPPTR